MVTKVTIEEIQKQRLLNEEQQEFNQRIATSVERQIEAYDQLYNKEQRLNERLLNYFHGHEEFREFEYMADDMRSEQRRLFEQLDETQEILHSEQRKLVSDSETLYDEELHLLREEESTDG